MGLQHRQPFVFTSKFVARKSFIFDGKEYKPGDDFDPEEVGCDARKLRNMYNASLLSNKPEGEEKAKKVKAPTLADDEDAEWEAKRKARKEKREAKKALDSLEVPKKKRK
jgi:hypothetical protein